MIIVNEARRRGIHVEVTDAEGGFFRLTYGGRSIHCRESLSELTTAVAMSICDDKAVARRVVERAGVRVPAQIEAGTREALEAFLEEHGSVVVKPARGEQGRGVAVGLTTMEEVEQAIETAQDRVRPRRRGGMRRRRGPPPDRHRLPPGRGGDPPAGACGRRRPLHGEGADRGTKPPARGGDRRRIAHSHGCGDDALRCRGGLFHGRGAAGGQGRSWCARPPTCTPAAPSTT